MPEAQSARYSRSFIKLAVCELRFPTMLEYEERAPSAFSKAVRHDYPIYEKLQVESSSTAPGVGHSFRSSNRRWTATVRSSALSLETTLYESFHDFRTRIDTLIKAAKSTVQSEFFTRIGLRYVNAVHCEPSALAEWINPALVGPLAQGSYGHVDEHWQRVRGSTRSGGYNFMHGLASGESDKPEREYVLDFDFYSENVELGQVLPTLDALHAELFSMFHWTLGPAATREP